MTLKKSIYFLYPEVWSLWGFLPVLLTVVSGKELYPLDYQKRFKNTITVVFSNNPRHQLLLLLSCFSRVWLCATPLTEVHHIPKSLGFSRQEHWSGLTFPSPMHESEKWKGSRSVVSDSLQPHGLQPSRLLRPWNFPGKSIGEGCHCLLPKTTYLILILLNRQIQANHTSGSQFNQLIHIMNIQLKKIKRHMNREKDVAK